MSVQIPPNSTGQVIDTATTVAGKERQIVMTNCAPPGSGNAFNLVHTPATATQATISAPAGAAGVRNVCNALSFGLQSIGTIQPVIQVNLRDGATGAGTILWSVSIGLAVSSYFAFSAAGLNIVGSAATAMTLEFSAAGAAATSESVALNGYTTA
jgi:hypothetical protein